MITHQQSRRNWTTEERAYFIGKQYELEKQAQGGDRKSKGQNGPLITTAEAMAAEHHIGQRTVKHHATYAQAVDTVTAASPVVLIQTGLYDDLVPALNHRRVSRARRRSR